MKQILRSLCTLLLLMMWCSVGFAAAGDNFTLVTAESELKAGDIIIIVNQEEKKALSTNQKRNNRGATLVTISGNNVTSSDETQEITLEGASGAWYFNVGNGYLYADGNNNSRTLKTKIGGKNGDYSKAAIVITATKTTITFQGNNTNKKLQYNSQSNLFSCYSTTHEAVAIYKKAATKTLTSLAISGEPTKKAYNAGEAFDPTGLVVTGTYDDASTATITDGITWTKAPATLTIGATSCSVTATVNGVTSPAFNVTGLTVTKTITLSVDPATSTVVKAPVKVTLTADAGATIYYTTNGDDPTTTSTKYTAPFEVTTSGTTVKALAVAEGAENATAEATYTIKPDQPVFSDETKTFKDAFNVTLSLPESTDASSTIHYTIDRTTATAESPLYEGPINISAENDGDKVILHAVVVDQYGNVGKEKFCTYTKTTAIVFDFTANSNAWGIKPQKNNSKDGSNVVAGKELKVSGIVMTATNGDLGTCLYGTTDDYNLRVYKGSSITFTAPEGYNITEITFNGSTKIKSLIPDKGTNNNGTWTGNAHAVKFSNNDSGIEIKTATIKLVASTLPLNETTTAEDAKTLLEANWNKTVNVTINRTLVANKWNTLCLPFDVTAEQIKNILKAEGMVREYKDQTADCINFQAAETMTAGVPYLIKPTEEVKGLTFEGVKITAIEGVAKGAEAGSTDENLSICGVLGAKALSTDGSELFLNAAGKFVAPAAATNTMKGFRAYFMSLLGAGAKINIDGETTGINSIETEATVNGKVYNLNGQYVGNSLNGLKKGIYVVNGKKVIK